MQQVRCRACFCSCMLLFLSPTRPTHMLGFIRGKEGAPNSILPQGVAMMPISLHTALIPIPACCCASHIGALGGCRCWLLLLVLLPLLLLLARSLYLHGSPHVCYQWSYAWVVHPLLHCFRCRIVADLLDGLVKLQHHHQQQQQHGRRQQHSHTLCTTSTHLSKALICMSAIQAAAIVARNKCFMYRS
jgi:hypothetical protein